MSRGGLATLLPFLHLAHPPRVFVLYWCEDAGGKEALSDIVATVNALKAGVEKHDPVSIDELFLPDDDAWLELSEGVPTHCCCRQEGELEKYVHIYIHIYICCRVKNWSKVWDF